MSVAYFEEQRREMIAAIRVIAEHLVAEIGKTTLDDQVLSAMAKVPRHEFVPIEVQPYAYLNRPLPIGFATAMEGLSDCAGIGRDASDAVADFCARSSR